MAIELMRESSRLASGNSSRGRLTAGKEAPALETFRSSFVVNSTFCPHADARLGHDHDSHRRSHAGFRDQERCGRAAALDCRGDLLGGVRGGGRLGRRRQPASLRKPGPRQLPPPRPGARPHRRAGLVRSRPAPDGPARRRAPPLVAPDRCADRRAHSRRQHLRRRREIRAHRLAAPDALRDDGRRGGDRRPRSAGAPRRSGRWCSRSSSSIR